MRLTIKWLNGWAYAHGTAPGGKRIRRALGTQDARRAKEACAHLEAKLWKAAHYGPESVVTFGECALAYAKDGGEVRFLEKIAEQLDGTLLRDVTPNMIRDAARRAYPKAAPSTLNRQGITPAQAVVNYGHKQGWCGMIRVERLKDTKPERKAVDAGYIDAMRQHLPERAYAVLLFLHTTGRRVGDALGLTPKDRDGQTIRIGKTKNGDPATVTITPELAAMLDALPPRHGLIFGYKGRSSLYPTLRRAARKAGVEYLGTHQPGRHSFATMLMEGGWGTKAIAEAGGWKSVKIVAETYEHPTDIQAKASRLVGKKMASYAKSQARKANGNKR